MTEVCAQRGAGDVTVAHVVARCGVSRRTFYEVFEDREDCFLGAFDDSAARAAERVIAAYERSRTWQGRIRLALEALLEFFDEHPDVGKLLVVESLVAGPKALERRRGLLAQACLAVDEGRLRRAGGAELPQLTAEGVVGGVLSVLHGRLSERNAAGLVELANPLMSMIVLPYLGAAAARRELSRPQPERHPSNGRPAGDPLRDLGIRLTYRTVCVLLSVAAAPGASNRDVGIASGVSDQGQISRLLSRMERLGLMLNLGGEPGRGGSNAWSLTERGAEIARAMGARAGWVGS
jgi:AcrR family transcriptional regulator